MYSNIQEEEKLNNNIKIETPSRLIQKLNEKKIYYQPYIISKNIKMKQIPNYNHIKTYNPIASNQIQFSQKTYNLPPKINDNLHTPIAYKNNIYNNNIYNKKKLNSCYTYSSVVSAKNSTKSNPYTNIQRNNINPINYIPYNCTEFQMKNKTDIKNENNKSPNILIKNIYPSDDYFTKNIKEGILCLKDYEILKSNKISFMDISNDKIKQNKKKDISQTLSRFLIKPKKKNYSFSEGKNSKYYESKKSYDSIKNKTRTVSKTLANGNKIERYLSENYNKKNKYNKGKISNVLNFFNNKINISDIIITRGMRNEKGGVVDFATNSQKKNCIKNKYIINKDITNKNIYKYPNWKIINSAKTIQKWWRNKIFLYNDYINKIKLIQNFYRNYNTKKYKQKNNNKNNKSNLKENEKNKLDEFKYKYKIFSITLIKKVIEAKLIKIYSYIILSIKDKILTRKNEEVLKEKQIYYIHKIKEYIKKIRKKYYKLFIKQISLHNFYKNMKIKKELNLFIKCERKSKSYIYNNFNNKTNNPLNNNNLKEIKNIKINISSNSDYIRKKKANKYKIDKNIFFVINSTDNNNKKISKNSSKIILNEKNIRIFSKVNKNPNEIAKYILKKIYLIQWYKQMIKIRNAKRTRVDLWKKKKEENKHLLLKNIMMNILKKIKKEADRRTLIIAFRDINKLKYPILYYALLKIQKYSIVKYNVLNAYAQLIQKNYRYFKDKKSKTNNQYI